MPPENRIDHTTVANAKENARLEPIPQPELKIPGWVAIVFVGVGGALAAAIPFVTGPWVIAVQVALGAVTAIGAGLGMASSGKR